MYRCFLYLQFTGCVTGSQYNYEVTMHDTVYEEAMNRKQRNEFCYNTVSRETQEHCYNVSIFYSFSKSLA